MTRAHAANCRLLVVSVRAVVYEGALAAQPSRKTKTIGHLLRKHYQP